MVEANGTPALPYPIPMHLARNIGEACQHSFTGWALDVSSVAPTGDSSERDRAMQLSRKEKKVLCNICD